MIIPVKTTSGKYDIVLERGALATAADYMNLNRKVLIVTDSGVPTEYSGTIRKQCADGTVYVFEQGETSKNMDTFKNILEKLTENDFTRSDCVVAVGGGVTGDMAGFAAACYMRGIDFYNIPTTMLSQVDSSIGGKTAIDFMGYKNIVGAFYPPKCVIIDPDTLSTLPKRQLSNGLSEALKMSVTNDAKLFEIFEKGDIYNNIDLIIEKSLYIKRSVVEKDEREAGLRRVLNFGHTVAHAIESVNEMKNLYHGECVAIGMLPMCSEEVKKRLIPVLSRLGLPTNCECDTERIIEAMKHDKKAAGNDITVVVSDKIGSFKFETIPFPELEDRIRRAAVL